MNLRRKVLRELAHMTVVPIFLIGLGLYALEFVISGLMAKPELNFSIIAAFIFALALAYGALFGLFDDIAGLEAIRVDHLRRRPGVDPDVYDRPATVFRRPKLLGYGYGLISEELQGGASTRITTETVHLMVADVDQRIAEMRSTLGYFGGLLILMGLLGAFMGLMKTVHAVSDLIASMDMTGAEGTAAFAKMIEGMKAPLNGMSVGFSSSLFGLLFSLALGLVDRFVINAMKAVRNDFEATLISLTQLGPAEHAGESLAAERIGAGAGSAAAAFSSEDIRAIRHSNERVREDVAELAATVSSIAQMTRSNHQIEAVQTVLQRAFEALAQTQKDIAMQMSRFADSSLTASDSRADFENRMVAAVERQADLLREIASQNMLARNLAMISSPQTQTVSGVPGGRSGGISVQINEAAESKPQAPAKTSSFMDRALASVVNYIGIGFPSETAPQNPRISARPAPRSQDAAILRAQENSQSLVREILRRMDESKREDRRIVRELSRRQDALVTELADLSRQIGDVMRTHDVSPRDKMESLTVELANLQRSTASEVRRLEAHVVAARRTSERAEVASQTAALHAERAADSSQRRSRT